MKKMLFVIMLPFVLAFISFVSVIHAKNYRGTWKYYSGGRISDFLYFRRSHTVLSWPFIYKDERLVGYAFVCIGDRLIIYSIEDEEIGEYIEK